MKTTIGTQVAHVTRDSDTTSKVKRSKVTVTGAGAYCGGSRTARMFTRMAGEIANFSL